MAPFSIRRTAAVMAATGLAIEAHRTGPLDVAIADPTDGGETTAATGGVHLAGIMHILNR